MNVKYNGYYTPTAEPDERLRVFHEGSTRTHLYLPSRPEKSVCGAQTAMYFTAEDLDVFGGDLSEHSDMCALCSRWFNHPDREVEA